MSADGDTIGIFSGVSAFSGQGYVQITWGAESGQLTPAEARMHALAVLEAAEAAEHDALVVAELTEGMGVEQQSALAFLVNLRGRRQQEQRRQGR